MDNMTWTDFQKWQRWDEFPEFADNPPLTVDVSFVYENKVYYLVHDYGEYHIYDSKWNAVRSHKNLKTLLSVSLELFHGKSFAEICNELSFD
ncbi:MAG: hypothetical protein IKS10_04235 [Lachnospiraceae bacterium]|nr:hypothetical protein [Lachnospiraceae bacterium]